MREWISGLCGGGDGVPSMGVINVFYLTCIGLCLHWNSTSEHGYILLLLPLTDINFFVNIYSNG